MLGVMLQKLWHKKWMVICLLIGSILLVATVVSFPMYRRAAFDRMLRDEFSQELAEKGEWPGRVNMMITSKPEEAGAKLYQMEDMAEHLYEKLGVTEKEIIRFYGTIKRKADSLMMREDMESVYLRLAMMSDFPAHVQMQAGEMYSEDGIAEDGSIEVVISQECMVASELLVGETLVFEDVLDANENPISIRIMGVYEAINEDDFYWQVKPGDMTAVCLMNEDLFSKLFLGENVEKQTMLCNIYTMFEYSDLESTGVSQLYEETKKLTEDENYRKIVSGTETYMYLLEEYEKKRTRIEATLFILQMPVLILLCAFLFMISAQMYDMERNEISVLKSRGSSGTQIFRLYFYQSIFLSLAGTVLGLPLGALFSRILGSARNFLEFDIRGQLDISYGKDVFLYALGAICCSILIMTLPAIKHSRVTIVNLKQQKALKRKSLWEKCFLDVICLAIGLYGYYNFSTNESVMLQSVMNGEALDPLLYLSSSIFIVGAGLLFLRLQPLLVRLIYFVGKKFWGPASYASFMENLKNGRKQQFIMLFLILTISLGMYHATVARTILQNALDNAEYLDGADVVIQEVWEENPLFALSEDASEMQYEEPDYFKYGDLTCVDSYTKVLYDKGGYVSLSGKGRAATTVMGIHTREFGESTDMDESLLEKPYYEYLNELAVEPDGILVSRSFQTVLGYKVGDKIAYYDSIGRGYTGKIVDFFDYWPGYQPTRMNLNSDGSISTSERYMVVGHYSAMKKTWGSIPYEIWMSANVDNVNDEIYKWVEENDIQLEKYVNRQLSREQVVEDPLLQGTNGVLTMGFIVTMILCAVGYMIYWIMSIRSREMLFGVLRACGMHKGELFHMLINEQIFSGAFSVAAGIVIGKIASKMFVPMLQTAYMASNQVLPMQLITNQTDMVRLYGVIVGTMATCLLVLIVIVFKLNVAKALKLGEE